MAVPDYAPSLFTSDDVGAPVINSDTGSVVRAMIACLVNGYSVRALTQIVVTAGVAVATSANHGYTAVAGKLLLIEGAPQAGLNGRVQPTAVTTNTFTYSAAGVPDGTYTGSISAKRAPLGWSLVAASGANDRAVFARTDPAATATQLYVNDTKAVTTVAATVSMVSAATSVDAFTEQFPTTGYPYWLRGADTADAKKWVIAGDSKRLFFLCQKSTGSYPMLNVFGDPVALYPGDAGGCLLTHHGSSSTNAAGGLTGANFVDYDPSSGGTSAAIGFHKNRTSGAVGDQGALCGRATFGSAGMSSSSAAVPLLSDIYIKTASEVRARIPGIYLPQGVTPFADMAEVLAPGIDRTLAAVSIMVSTTGVGQVLFDTTGPWD